MRTIAIIGGTGFVGRQLASVLAKQNWQIRILSRNSEVKQDLSVLPNATLINIDYGDQNALNEAVSGCDAVVNLVGILNESGRDGSGFRKAHVNLAENVVTACQTNQISRLLHMSALNADAEKGTSHYLRTKGEAEDFVHAAQDINVTSFRPSVIFGIEDSFFNRFAALLKLSPMLPLASSNSRFAPIYVGDVVKAMADSIDDKKTYDQRYNLCGANEYTLKQLVQMTADMIGIKRAIIGLPQWAGKIQAQVFEFVPTKPLSVDNLNSLQMDSVCECNDLVDKLGIEPTTIESVMPRHFAQDTHKGQYDNYRQQARRN
ncbi:complex I NDUFA9 subunit family protein [Candidatus Albibeggiatoa sp. nov. NOAA]|uniref:complex I NDUFA9 subunit family protein n=1 Tax=Candidatus Albibeggiatoa sp. nov. NOAA TaxID=3162724 RepID=UPI0032F66720|nr:complex I NDUFA9 subunit family protein [Thiotrichaceae bacterium]